MKRQSFADKVEVMNETLWHYHKLKITPEIAREILKKDRFLAKEVRYGSLTDTMPREYLGEWVAELVAGMPHWPSICEDEPGYTLKFSNALVEGARAKGCELDEIWTLAYEAGTSPLLGI